MTTIAIDLTPMLPGGDNGGAKVLALDLVRRLPRLAPRYRFLLLTSSANHQEVGALVGDGVERLHVLQDGSAPALLSTSLATRLLSGSRAAALRFFPGGLGRALVARARRLLAHLARPHESGPGLRERRVGLLFCPFTAPTYAEPGIPVVSILYDLQHLDYPEFFASQELAVRALHLQWLRRWSDRVVCISEHSRRSLLRHLEIPADRTRVVPIAVHERLPALSSSQVAAVRARFGLARNYALYPANDWPHKNHRLLLAAFGLLLARHPRMEVDLVLTGAFGRAADELATAASRMGLRNRIHPLGYVPEDELAALYQGCGMVVFPSLYEGFGIPVLEAMQFGKPVACSAVTSLPEVGGDCVRYFDPRRLEDIAAAMGEVLDNPATAEELGRRGRERAASYSGEAVAAAYAAMFDELVQEQPATRDSVAGVFADGWTSGVLRLAHSRGAPGRTLELELEAPAFLPHASVAIDVRRGSRQRDHRWWLRRGDRQTVKIPLPGEAGYLSVTVRSLFRPLEHGLGEDTRLLGCLCRCVRIVEGDRPGSNLLASGEPARA